MGFGGWLLGYKEMLDLGFDPYKDARNVVFLGTQPREIQAVLNREVDAAVIRTGVLEKLSSQGKINIDDFRVLAAKTHPEFNLKVSTPLYPEWAFARTRKVSNELAKAVALALLRLESNSAIAQQARFQEWTFPYDYQPVHDLLKSLQVDPYSNHGSVDLQEVVAEHWIEIIIIVASVLALYIVILIWNRKLENEVTTRKNVEQTLRESEERLRGLYELSPLGIALTDMHGQFLEFNEAFREICGYNLKELQKLDYWTLTPEKYKDDEVRQLELLRKKGRYGPYEKEYRRKNGTLIPLNLNGMLVHGANGQQYIWSIVEDISKRRKVEEQQRLAASVFSHTREGIAITDMQGNIVDVNGAFADITGYQCEEAMGRNLLTMKGAAGGSSYSTGIQPALECNGYWSGELWSRRKDGMTYAETLTISAVEDVTGSASHYVALFSDVTAQKRHQIQLEHIAHHDSLTNLPNRVLLADRLSQAMAQAQRRKTLLAVVYLDLDGFKEINDTHGHDIGDRFLVAIAQRITNSVRQGDTCARLGGDEFVAVLVDLPNPDACTPLLNRLLGAVVEPLTLNSSYLRVSASVGVTFYPQENPVDADQLLRQSDQAMYQAKLAGKNRFHLFDSTQDAHTRVRHETLARIHQALSATEFRLYFQPKVNMRTGEVIGFEALIRWQHPDRGLLLPGDLLPTVANHPLGSEVDLWVIETALTQMEKWQTQGIPTAISVNLGAELIQRSDFITSLRQLFEVHPQADPRWLELEIVETSALEDITQVQEIMASCNEMGVGFALDDFGTGYSSLTYLRRLAVNHLKIDQSFVRDMHDDPEDLLIVEGILSLASALRRQVIAEGVETISQAETLVHLGCELAQGFAFAKPMPAETCADWLRDWKPESALIRARNTALSEGAS